MCANKRDYSRAGQAVTDGEQLDVVAYSVPCPNCGVKVDKLYFSTTLQCPLCGNKFVDNFSLVKEEK